MYFDKLECTNEVLSIGLLMMPLAYYKDSVIGSFHVLLLLLLQVPGN